MIIKDCLDCKHGTEQSGSSFCMKEAYSSFFTKCIQNKALEVFLENNSISDSENDPDRVMDRVNKHNAT